MALSPKKEQTLGIDPNNNQNRISEGTKIMGNVTTHGGFRVDGEIQGDVQSPGKVVIGAAGKIVGNLTCKDAEVEGFMKGILNVAGLLSLRATAKVEGEVTTSKLSVEPGATFNATCDMNANKPSTFTDAGQKTATTAQ